MELFFKHILYFFPISCIYNMIRRKAINRLMSPIEKGELSSLLSSGDEGFDRRSPALLFSLRLPPFLNWKVENELEVFEISHLLFRGIRFVSIVCSRTYMKM